MTDTTTDRAMRAHHLLYDEDRADPQAIGPALDDGAWVCVGGVHLEMLDDDRAYLALHEEGTSRTVQVEIQGHALSLRLSHDDLDSALASPGHLPVPPASTYAPDVTGPDSGRAVARGPKSPAGDRKATTSHVEWAVTYDDGDMDACGTHESEARRVVAIDPSARILTRTVTTTTTPWTEENA